MNASVVQDLRIALRSFKAKPGLAALIILTAALAIGASTALFDLANLIAWMPIPGANSERLVRIHTKHPQEFVGIYGPVAATDHTEYKQSASSFEAIVGERAETLTLEPAFVDSNSPLPDTSRKAAPLQRPGAFSSVQVEARFVSGNFFEVLAPKVAWGRPLSPSDDRTEAEAVAILSDRFFRSHLAGSNDLLGATVLLNSQSVTVVGVTAPGFEVLVAGNKADLWLSDQLGTRFVPTYKEYPLVPSTDTLGKLRKDVTLEQAQSELEILAAELDRTQPLPSMKRTVTVVPARLTHGIDQRNFQPILKLLGVAVLLLIALACANIGNLLLGRSLERAREISVRTALGANRSRIVRQLLTESLVLALMAGAAGIALALAGRRLFALWELGVFAKEMRFDHRVLAGSIATSIVVALLFGTLPALAATRPNLVSSLKDGAGAAQRSTLLGFQWLAGLQLTLATILLISTGAIAANLWSLKNIDLGFDDSGLVRSMLFLDAFGYSSEEAMRFMVDLEQRVSALPNVTATSRALFMPPVYLSVDRTFSRPEEPDLERRSRMNLVDDGYFDTLGVPVIAGRTFDDREREGAPVVIINEMLQRQLWPEDEPGDSLGRTLIVAKRRPFDPEPEHRIVGVVDTIKQHDLRSNGEPVLYLPIDQRPRPTLGLVARTKGDPAKFVETLRAEIKAGDPRVEPSSVQTSAQLRWDALVVHRMQSQSVAMLAVVGVVLSLLGVFGVMQLIVNQRRREVGIRMAVGATQSGIKRWVLGRSARIAASGIVAGLIGAALAGRLLRSWVSDLGATPLWIYTGSVGLLLVAALLASYLPARRAAGVEPSVVLRSD